MLNSSILFVQRMTDVTNILKYGDKSKDSCSFNILIQFQEGVTRLVWDSSGMNVFTGCTDGICRQWNARTGEIISTFVGHRDQILDISISK